jgi:hypothetical protein
LSLPPKKKKARLLIQVTDIPMKILQLSLKTKFIVELYVPTKPIIELMSAWNSKEARELALKLMLQVTPPQKSSGVRGLFSGS